MLNAGFWFALENGCYVMEISDNRIEQLKKLESSLQYSFEDIALLDTALTHTSYVKGENRSSGHNERLEFLGDAVLELIVSEYLFVNNKNMNEGLMTRIRARAVYENALFDSAMSINLGSYLLLSHGEDHTGGRSKPSILSDALEAVIGAVYIDGGIEPAKRFILSFAIEHINDAVKSITVKDNKTLLQEYVQQEHKGELEYTVISVSGPDHKRTFTMQVMINNKPYGIGHGLSKQEAGQNAARASLIMLGAAEPSAESLTDCKSEGFDEQSCDEERTVLNKNGVEHKKRTVTYATRGTKTAKVSDGSPKSE